jgi:hypothetical protein
MYLACPFHGHVEVVLLERKYSRFRLFSGKYTFPSTISVVSLSAITLPFQIAFAISLSHRVRRGIGATANMNLQNINRDWTR